MLENLLVLLNSAVIIGVGPPPAEFGTSSSDVRLISPPRMPGTASGLREGYVVLLYKITIKQRDCMLFPCLIYHQRIHR